MPRLLLFFSALPLLATPPVVSNVTTIYTGFASTTVTFSASASYNDVDVLYALAPNVCTSGGTQGGGTFNFPVSGSGFTSLSIQGLTPGASYQVCVEDSADGGTTWSTPVGTNLVLNPRPVTPVPPVTPVAVDTSEPDYTKGTCYSNSKPGYCSVVVQTPCVIGGSSPPAGSVLAAVDTAGSNQSTAGTVVLIPAGQVCNDNNVSANYNYGNGPQVMYPPDGITYNTALIANNTITMGSALSSYTQAGPSGIVEGLGISFTLYINPSGSYFYPPNTTDANGAVQALPDYLYFVHQTGTNTFELYWPYTRITNVSLTSGSSTIHVSSLLGQGGDTPGVAVGAEVAGSGIPANTTVSAISGQDGSYTITLSAAATATETSTLSFGGGNLTDIGVSNNMPVPITAHGTGNGEIFYPHPRNLYTIDIRSCVTGVNCVASWSSTVAYVTGNMVTVGGEAYTATASSTNQAPPNASYWSDSGTLQKMLDSTLPPPGSRISPAWLPNLATLQKPALGGGNFIDIGGGAANIRFTGVRIIYSKNTELSSDPVMDGALFWTTSSNDDIILDRVLSDDGNYTFDNRASWIANWGGHDIAIIDSYFQLPISWNADYAPYPYTVGNGPSESSATPTQVSSTSFSIAPLSVGYGAPSPAILSSALTVSWTGTPTNTITSPEILAYYDMANTLHVVGPTGITITAPGATIGYTSTSGNGTCKEGDPIAPVDGNGRGTLAPIGCANLNAAGTIASLVAGSIPGMGAPNKVGSAFYTTNGSGPLTLANNYIQSSGIMFIESLENSAMSHDYVIDRNTFHFPSTYLPLSTNQYVRAANMTSYDTQTSDHEQPIEFKRGSRILIEGNDFNGGVHGDGSAGFAMDLTSSPPYSLEPITPVLGGDTDVHVTDNTVEHFPDGVGCPFVYTANWMQSNAFRCEINNNLLWDIDGLMYSYSDTLNYGSTGGGMGSLTSLGAYDEGAIIDHNTYYPNFGTEAQAIDTKAGGPTEPFYPAITNNIFPYGLNANGSTYVFSSNCGAGDSTSLSCWDATFQGNLIIPAYGVAVAYPPGSAAQIASSTISTNLGSFTSGNTIVNNDTNVMTTLNDVKWNNLQGIVVPPAGSWDYSGNYTGPVLNFHLLSQSSYNYGQTTDGLQEGANVDQLEAAQGKVTLTGVNQITSTSANITYVAPDSASCSVDYSSSDPNVITSFTRVQDTGGARVRNVALTGLAATTKYYVRVDCAVQQPPTAFTTQ